MTETRMESVQMWNLKQKSNLQDYDVNQGWWIRITLNNNMLEIIVRKWPRIRWKTDSETGTGNTLPVQ